MTTVSYRTAEALYSSERVWESNQGNAIATQMECRESDMPIVPQKSVKADGGKGHTFSSVRQGVAVQTGELWENGAQRG